jgi:hypothetical protein
MDSAEKLRTAVVDAARDECLAYTESAGSYLGDRMAWDEDVGVYGPAACVLRAIVEELGLDVEMVADLRERMLISGMVPFDEATRLAFRKEAIAEALSTLLHAAGIAPTKED